MKVVRAALYDDDWRLIDAIIRKNMNDELCALWDAAGYEGLATLVPKMFGMKDMYRDASGTIVWEFTDEQWTWFSIKWLNDC